MLERARSLGICGFVSAGVDPGGWRTQAEVAQRHADVFVTFGFHPRWVAASSEPATEDAVADDLSILRAACTEHPIDAQPQHKNLRPVALGEIGLDRSRHVLPDSFERQESYFRAQLALARDLNLPVVLHVVRAHGAALDIMRRDGLPRAGGVMHSYSGPAEMVPDFAALGLMFSFSGAATFPAAKKLRRAAVVVPAHLLLIETDAPDLTPAPKHPQRNEPAFLVEVCAEIATLRNARPEAIAALTEQNAKRLFGL